MTSGEAWAHLTGDQTVSEWIAYRGPTSAERIEREYLHPSAHSPYAIADARERQHVAELIARYVADHARAG
jgi:hypothetical protein